MNYNDQMRAKLKSNIKVVSFIIAVSLIFTGIKLYQIFATDLLDIQSVMTLKEYFPLLFTGYGLVALLVSILTYYKFDNFYPQHQVILFCFVGMAFMPFTVILFVIGIMKYMDSKKKFKPHFFGSSLAGMIFFGVIISIVLTPLSNIKPVYLNEHVIEAEYRINEENYIELTVTGLYRGYDLQKLMFDAIIHLDAPNTDLVGTEFVQVSMNQKRTCIVYAFDEAQDQYQLSCEITEFSPGLNQEYTLTDFVNFEDLYLEYGNVDYDHIINTVHAGAMQIVSNQIIPNVWDKYNEEN